MSHGSAGQSTRPERDYWPTASWKTAEPEAVGMRSDLMKQITSFALETAAPVNGIVIARHGYIVYEEYFRGFTYQSLHTINSVTKSVLSTVVGCALRCGHLNTLDQALVEFFPEVDAPEIDPRVRAITLRHLLTLTSGWKPDPRPGPIAAEDFVSRADLFGRALRRPLLHQPGTKFSYDMWDPQIVSMLISRVTGSSVAEFALQSLFVHMGIWGEEATKYAWRDNDARCTFHPRGLWDEGTGLPWKVDASGFSIGSMGLHLTLRDMARFGFLYLNEGRWEGKQLIPTDYVAESMRPYSNGGPPVDAPYGLMWWLPHHPIRHYAAVGFGGQRLLVLPELDLVMAITSSMWGHAAQILDQFVVPSVGEP